MDNQISTIHIAITVGFGILWFLFRDMRETKLNKALAEIGGNNIVQNGVKVEGILNTRKFSIDPESIGRSGYISYLILESSYSGTIVVFAPGFFENFPDWDAVSEEFDTPRRREEGDSERFKEAYGAILLAVDEKFGPLSSIMRKSLLRVQPGRIILRCPGLLGDESASFFKIMQEVAGKFEKSDAA